MTSIIPDEAVQAGVKAVTENAYPTTEEATIACLSAALPFLTGVKQEPIGYLFQHEETGLTQVVEAQQVEWGFEKNNPRWQKISPVYSAPVSAPSPRAQALEECNRLLEKLEEGVKAYGLHTDNETELFDIDGATETMLEAAASIRALSSQPVADGWLPIETAPKDGTSIIIWSTVYGGTPVIVRWHEDTYAKRPIPRWITGDSAYGARSFVDSQPTHWRPLPSSPGASDTRPTGGSNHGE
ncbi:hypothetical protein [Brucella pituitosa]|uniref:hypothetical protein n=1 Tax=Brucella pituitosa TaxID=571256 RepID=UPI0009A1C096|nr:hypothetical protein [Brucella pituitosa]